MPIHPSPGLPSLVSVNLGTPFHLRQLGDRDRDGIDRIVLEPIHCRPDPFDPIGAISAEFEARLRPGGKGKVRPTVCLLGGSGKPWASTATSLGQAGPLRFRRCVL
jgi:hypothetical protein